MLKKSTTVAQSMDAEDAAVFLADESRHPYDWQRILDDRRFYRVCQRKVERLIAGHPELGHLQPRLLEATKVLDRRHRV